MKKALLLGALIASPALAQTNIEIAYWYNDAYGAYSLNHDDYCIDNTFGVTQFAIPELNKRGLKAAFGVIPSDCLDEHWQTMKQAITAGHEVYNHAYTSVTPKDEGWSNEEQILLPDSIIQEKLSYQPRFFAFTQDLGSDDALSYLKKLPHYVGTRAINYVDNTGINFFEDKNDFAVRYDLYTQNGQWSMYEKKKKGKDILNLHVDMAIQTGGWAYRTAHGVEDTSWNTIPLTEYVEHLDHVKKKVDEGELWMATVSDVIQYRATKRDCALTINETEQHAQLAFAITPACKKVATKVTFIVNNNVKQVLQNEKALVLNKNDGKQAMFNANPLDGNITVKF